MFRRLALALILAVATPACAGVIAALPKIARIITSIMAILVGANNGVQEIFRMSPDIPKDRRRQYAVAFEKVMTALRLLNESTEGGRDLGDANVQAALDHFMEAYQQWRQLMQKEGWMNDGGSIVVEGAVLAEVPPASELRL